MGIFPTRILLAIDDSEEAALATRRAIDLADTAGSELYLVHVGQLPNFLIEGSDIGGFYLGLYEDIERESLEVLRRLSWRVKISGGDVAGADLRMGNVAEEIVASAKELEADLVVMGSRGHGGLWRTIEGSISDLVVRRAPCAVMTVRGETTEKQRRFWRRIFSTGSENAT